MTQSSLKKLLFYIIALLIPVSVFVVSELWLRYDNKFEQQPLFVAVPALQGYLQPNPKIIRRFFPKPEMTPKVSPDTQYFKSEKPKDSFRIVVQGGSTAAGFPYGRWGSLSGMLQQRFKRIYPEKEIEIINTAMASVNSYTLLDFNAEIQSIKPDLVMIYAGHNEFLGIMGVGSAFAAKGGRGATLMYLKAKNLRLFRLVEHLYYEYFATAPDTDANQRTLMSKIAKEKAIPKTSELYQAGVEQFSGNLGLILQKYQSAGIPVMVGNLVSNEADQVPFSGISEFNKSELNKWLAASEEKKKSAINQLLHSEDRDPALTQFLVGKLTMSLGNHDSAKEYFQKARDLDLLRFRAPGEFNNVIEAVTEKHGALLVDVDANMRADSTHGIIGKQHMLEHLHPTERGYFVLADAFLQKFKQQHYTSDFNSYPDDKELAWQERPISKADAMYAEYKIGNLIGDYPFTKTPFKVAPPSGTSLEATAVRARINGEGWLELNHRLVPKYHNVKYFRQDALISGLLADALPQNRSWGYIAGLKYKEINNLPFALYYLHKELKIDPENITVRLSLAQTYYFLSRFKDSLQHLYYVKSNKPEHPNIDNLIATVKSKI